MKSIIIPIVVLLIGWADPAQSAPIHIQKEADSPVSLPLPYNRYGFDAADGYAGIITKDEHGGLMFHLFGDSGLEVFHTDPATDIKPFVVEMNDYDGVILLLEWIDETIYKFAAYDYRGDLLVGPVDSRALVKASPHGRFFYGINDFIEGNSRPAVFDSSGNQVALFRERSGWWCISAINDTLLIFQDGLHIVIESVPRMDVVSVADIQNVGNPPIVPSTAISKDGAFYAFLSATSYVVYDIDRDQVYHVGRSNPAGAPHLFLDSSANHLFAFDSPGFGMTVYGKVEDEYQLEIDHARLPLNKGAFDIFRSPEIADGFFIARYSYMGWSDVRFQSYMCPLTDAGSPDIENGTVIPGFAIALTRGDQPTILRVYQINEDSSGVTVVRDIHFTSGKEVGK